MLNVNSPTVQAMMQNTPQGFGNMPVYSGNTPMLTSTPQETINPFPSPKEMLMASGQQTVYMPTQMQPSYNPQQFVGGYNPGFNAAFSGYVNPYMGFGYSGFGYGMMYQPTPEEQLTLRLAAQNGLSYEEQLYNEESIYKTFVEIAGKNNNRTEEEIAAAKKHFEVYKKPVPELYQRKPVKFMKVAITRGDEVIAEVTPPSYNVYYSPPNENDPRKATYEANRQAIVAAFKRVHDTSTERFADNADIIDYFNNHLPRLYREDLEMMAKMQAVSRSAQMYNHEKFATLLKNNGGKTRAQIKAVDRFMGRYGIMPDGRPVSPSHDPSIADSFSRHPITGQLSVTAPIFNTNTGRMEIPPPSFMECANTIERARARFMKSIDEGR